MKSLKVSESTYGKIIALKAYYEAQDRQAHSIAETIDTLFTEAMMDLKLPDKVIKDSPR